MIEAGARFEDEDLPETSFEVSKYLFRPEVGCYGIQRIDALRDCLIVSGAGVGGGSLVYANTLYEPMSPFYDDPQWSHITDWRDELAPYYDQAKRMLGVVENPLRTPSDDVMEKVATEMGVADTFHPTPVGVFFGDEGAGMGQTVDDPFFGGAGPERKTCIGCGSCMTGCRHNAKNTLVKNYLHLAEGNGADGAAAHHGHPGRAPRRRRVRRPRPLHEGEGQPPYVAPRAHRRAGRVRGVRARHPATAAPDEGRGPPAAGLRPARSPVAHQLGVDRRRHRAPGTDVDYSQGIAITSSFHPDENTHIEPVRYGPGSNLMSLLQSVLTDGDGDEPRWRTWLREMWAQRRDVANLYDMKHWSERTVIALVMQSLDNSITTYTKRIPFTRKRYVTSKQGHGVPNPTWIPAGNEAIRTMAEIMDGFPGSAVGDAFNKPLTAHFIGGCAIGDSPETGVVDPYQRVYGHPGLHVADGSAVTANLGVNPSLTITAQAERAMAFWPNKGEADERPDLGAPYRRIEPVRPVAPVVPADAPGALRLPIVGVS